MIHGILTRAAVLAAPLLLLAACNGASTVGSAPSTTAAMAAPTAVKQAPDGASFDRLTACGPIPLEFQVVGSSASGRVDLIFERNGTQAAARLANFKTNSLTSSPEGPVADLVVEGDAVSFKSKTGFSYDLLFDGCTLVKGSGHGDHPQAGRIWLAVTS